MDRRCRGSDHRGRGSLACQPGQPGEHGLVHRLLQPGHHRGLRRRVGEHGRRCLHPPGDHRPAVRRERLGAGHPRIPPARRLIGPVALRSRLHLHGLLAHLPRLHGTCVAASRRRGPERALRHRRYRRGCLRRRGTPEAGIQPRPGEGDDAGRGMGRHRHHGCPARVRTDGCARQQPRVPHHHPRWREGDRRRCRRAGRHGSQARRRHARRRRGRGR
jgi:hypothetical protein